MAALFVALLASMNSVNNPSSGVYCNTDLKPLASIDQVYSLRKSRVKARER